MRFLVKRKRIAIQNHSSQTRAKREREREIEREGGRETEREGVREGGSDGEKEREGGERARLEGHIFRDIGAIPLPS